MPLLLGCRFHGGIPTLHGFRDLLSSSRAHSSPFSRLNSCPPVPDFSATLSHCAAAKLTFDFSYFTFNLRSFRLKSLQSQFAQSMSIRHDCLPMIVLPVHLIVELADCIAFAFGNRCLYHAA